MFCRGDLIRVPSGAKLLKKKEELKLIDSFVLTTKPEIGIFIRYTNEGDCIINTYGENWIVPTRLVRIFEAKDDKISSNYETL